MHVLTEIYLFSLLLSFLSYCRYDYVVSSCRSLSVKCLSLWFQSLLLSP